MQNFDTNLFHAINSGFANPVFDFLMPIFTNEHLWIPIILLSLILLFWRGGRKGRFAAISLLIAFAIADPFAARVLKPMFGRIRPCYALETVRLIWHCGGKFSFPSNHATNAAAMVSAIGYFYRKWLYSLIPIAFVVGFSRIYVGVHYPTDVLGGFVLGTIIGICIAIPVFKLYSRKHKKEAKKDKNEMRNGQNIVAEK